MEMRDHDRAAVEPDEAQPPRQALAKEKIVAVVEHRLREELAAFGLRLPIQENRQALLAGLARRILHRAAIAALLQLGEAERRAAARCRRQRGQPGAQYGVFSFRANRLAHCAFSSTTAPDPRPRS